MIWQKAAQNAIIPLGYIFFQNYNELPKVAQLTKITQIRHPEYDLILKAIKHEIILTLDIQSLGFQLVGI